MSHWYRELTADPGPLGAWAGRLLASEPQQSCAAIAEADWPWPEAGPADYLDECRVLRTALLARDPVPAVVLLASPVPASGVSRLARALASLWTALPARSCLLISARRETGGPGLAELLAGDVEWETAVHRDRCDSQRFWMDAGQSALPLADLLSRPAWTATLDQCRMNFDLTIIDGVEAGAGASYDLMARSADATVLVARSGWTPHAMLASACRRIPPERFAGIVLNG